MSKAVEKANRTNGASAPSGDHESLGTVKERLESGLRNFKSDIEMATLASSRYSIVRFSIFILIVGAFFLPIGLGFRFGIAGALLLCFIFILIQHDSLRNRLKVLTLQETLTSERLTRLKTRRGSRSAPYTDDSPDEALEAGGLTHSQEMDSYALDAGIVDDLNLLSGPRSIFAFFDISSTSFGARRLQYWLCHPLLKPSDILLRQESVRELSEKEDLRNSLVEDLSYARGTHWDRIPPLLDGKYSFAKHQWLGILAHLSGSISLLGLLASAVFPVALSIVLPLIAFQFAAIGLSVKRSNPARDRLSSLGPILRRILSIHDILQKESSHKECISELSQQLATINLKSKKLLASIRLLSWHSMGVFFEIFNIISLWELRLLPKAEKLLEECAEELLHGMENIGELEAYLCMASFAAEQDGLSWPKPAESAKPFFDASSMGHPLLEDSELVRNSIQLGKDCNVLIVTGSNMAGKSTFLKSVGCNLVLAAAGGAVSAASFEWTPIAMYSDVNVRDSLDDGKSYFQVEVERVKAVVDAAATNPFLIAIFDELFRGTNSVERVAIAAALMRRLRDSGVLLIVATHDISLTELVTREAQAGMKNVHFREKVEDGYMSFDYVLRNGPAQSRNAIQVLASSGYPEEVVEQARAACIDNQ